MNVWSVQVDSGRHEVVGGPHRMTTNQEAATTVSLSRDGRRLAFDAAVRTSRIVSFELGPDGLARTGVGEPLTPDTVHAHSPDLSPDGAQVAFLRERLGTPAGIELVVLHRLTGHERVLAVGDRERGEVRGPPLRWSPDGTRLAYRYVLPDSQVPDGERRAFGSFQQARLFDLRSDQEYEITSPVQINDVPFGWSRNGDEIISTGRRHGADSSVVAGLPVTAAPHAERQARVLTIAPDAGTDVWQASVSPNGRWILFQATDGDRRRSRLVVAPAAGGGAWRDVTDGSAWDDKPRWSHDGSQVYFVTTRGGLVNVWAVSFDHEAGVARGEPRPVTHFTGPGEQILRHVGLMELAIREGHLVVPVVQPRGGIWMLENLTR